LAAGAVRAEGGIAFVAVAAPKDTPSSAAAVRVARAVDLAFAQEPRVEQLDLERFLGGGEPSQAQLRKKDAEVELKRANAAYDSVELIPALESSGSALIAFEQSVSTMDDLTPLLDTLALQGAVLVLQGDAKAGRKVFERLVAIDEGYALQGGRFPEAVKKAFREVSSRARDIPSGQLSVYATPAAAEVWVDGKFRGISPLTPPLSLRAGRHYVRVVRDGYDPFGTVVDVRKGAAATVQAPMRASMRFSTFDDLVGRVAHGGARAQAQLAAFLKVDQVLVLVVESEGDSATVQGTLVDGVTGTPLAEASKAFILNDDMLDRNVGSWALNNFVVMHEGGRAVNEPPVQDERGSFLPESPKTIETPEAVTWGWGLIIASGVSTFVGIGSGVASLVASANFKAVPTQVDPSLDTWRTTWLVTSIVADTFYVGAAATGITGAVFLVNGYTQKEQLEDVITERSPLPGEGLANALAAAQSSTSTSSNRAPSLGAR
jgi:hypothetical protein